MVAGARVVAAAVAAAAAAATTDGDGDSGGEGGGAAGGESKSGGVIEAAIGEGLATTQEEFAKQETLLNAAGLWKPGLHGSLQLLNKESSFFDRAAELEFMTAFSPLDKLVDSLAALYLPEDEDPPIQLIAMSMVLLQDLCKVVPRPRPKKRLEEPPLLDESEEPEASAAAPAAEQLQYAKGERAHSMLLFLADPLLCRSSNTVIKAHQEGEAAKKVKALRKKKKKSKRRENKENADAPRKKKKKGVEGR
mmetsp:Transcript_1115/g.4010  ORF Transcript_1115/g.4010 Transcript_1115/m.4010 type:complete len:250 (+) Transcript_1115:75-824(+)